MVQRIPINHAKNIDANLYKKNKWNSGIPNEGWLTQNMQSPPFPLNSDLF